MINPLAYLSPWRSCYLGTETLWSKATAESFLISINICTFSLQSECLSGSLRLSGNASFQSPDFCYCQIIKLSISTKKLEENKNQKNFSGPREHVGPSGPIWAVHLGAVEEVQVGRSWSAVVDDCDEATLVRTWPTSKGWSSPSLNRGFWEPGENRIDRFSPIQFRKIK